MNTIILFPLVGYIFHYLLARAMITRALWSNYPPWFDNWASCAACCSTWTTPTAALIGLYKNWTFFDLQPTELLYYIVAACWGMFWGPLLAYVHTWTLAQTYDSSNDGDSNVS